MSTRTECIRGRKPTLCILFLIISSFVFLPAEVASKENSNTRLNRLWTKVLQEPGDVVTNIDYALEAEKLGFYGRAIAAFRRALNTDPENVFALRRINRIKDLNKPGEISGTIIISSSHHSNASQARSNPQGDTTLSNTLVFSDDRKLFGTRWKSTLINYADAHSVQRGSDINFTSVNSGPIIKRPDGSQINVGLNIENTFIDNKIDSYSIGFSGGVIYEGKIIKNYDYGIKYIKANSEGNINYLNGFISSSIDVADDIIEKNDSIQLQASGTININRRGFNSSGTRDRLINVGINLNYNLLISPYKSVDVFYSPTYIHYFKHRKTDSRDRTDFTNEIGLSYNTRVFGDLNLTVSCVREQNFSNFSEFQYIDYHISTSLMTSF